ncbi:hypothetical protein L6164_031635 [Bauhinia variegata]|uniref:Uncharacterized protein n=1 Tax=Bauhinia variegata TaxID=167791 RepID=A0ACB9LGJ6_BAUVA|nr:hypothetical protein L6164_031635 [Bauhinia variegata]
MAGQSALSRTQGFRLKNLGQYAIAMIRNVCFSMFVILVLIFTIATYDPEDSLFHPSTKIANFFTSKSNATMKSDTTVIKTVEDFAVGTAVIDELTEPAESDLSECDVNSPIDCRDPEVFHLMISATIAKFKDTHFYKFGKAVQGDTNNSCDMAWRFRPKEETDAAASKDYRRFVVVRHENCTHSIVHMGEYHSGLNARKPKTKIKNAEREDIAIDSLPVVESETSFSRGKYLIYVGGGERCKNMNHYLWSFLCALGEAQYLKRTLVMDMSLCLSSIYTSSKLDEEGKDFRLYFDFKHLMNSTSVLDQGQFWTYWNDLHKKYGMKLHLVEDTWIKPMKLRRVKDALIMRKFGSVEPDNYWYGVCEGTSSVQKPWHLIKRSKRLMDIVSAIISKMNSDYDSVHILRGERARNKELWPNLDADTSPDALISALRDNVEEGRHLYIATNENDTSFFDPLRNKYKIHFLDEFMDLWGEKTEWYSEATKLNNGVPVEFDGYMRLSIDTEVFLRGKKKIETFNDLTKDCKDGINTCSVAMS